MIVEGLEQNSEEWLKWRRGKVGASDSSILAGQNKYKDIQYLWRDKLNLNEPEEQSIPARRGHDLEPLARQLYIDEYRQIMVPTLFVSDEVPFMAASVDGYNEAFNFLIEIKCPMRKSDIIKASHGIIKPDHYPQLQHQLFVTKASHVDYVVFDGLNQIYVNRVFPDLKYQRNLVRLAKWFWHKVENRLEIKKYDIVMTPSKETI